MKKTKKESKKIISTATKNSNHNKWSLFFSNFAKNAALLVGNPYVFMLAVIFILVWLVSGPYFHFSEDWQLVVNTGTTIVTFLIVFLIQHTQNRDTEIMNIKIDELIKGHKGSKNTIIDLSKLSDRELLELEESYKKLCARNKLKNN